MKKIFTAVVALALALTVVAPAAASAQTSASYTFNTNLTVGSRGADVVALQSFLETKGLLTIPAGVAKGYFGSMTRSAVAAYQTMKGIKPAAGYFGPITRAAVMAEAVATPVTPVTGNPVTPVTGLSNVEGFVDVLLSSAVTNNSNIQSSTDVPVYAIEYRGKIAPVSVQTLDLEVKVVSAGEDNPGTFINTIKVWDGSNVLVTVPVSLSTFIKDSTSNKYYVRIPGINFVVPQDTTKTLTVSFSTNYIDTARTVTVNTYGGSAGTSATMRTVTGNGVNLFYGPLSSRVHTFNKPGNSTVTVSASANPLRSKNVRFNTTSRVYSDAVLFNVKSENSDSKITRVVATTTVAGLPVSDMVIELYDGTTRLDSVTPTSFGTTTFGNLNITVGKDQTKTLKLVVGFPASTTAAAAASAKVTVDSVSYDNANGSNTTLDTNVMGDMQYAYGQSAAFALASTPTLVATSNNQSTTTTLTATFAVNVNPQGGDFNMSAASSTIVFLNSAGTVVKTVQGTVSKNTTTNIPDGSTEIVTVSAVLSSTDAAIAAGANQYRAKVAGFDWQVGSSAAKMQTTGFDDYITNLTTVTK